MFTNLLDKIDFVRKIFINTLFIIFLLIFFLLLIITPFMSKTVNTQDSILLLDASTQMQESSPLSGSVGLSNFQIVETIELATKDDDISLILKLDFILGRFIFVLTLIHKIKYSAG